MDLTFFGLKLPRVGFLVIQNLIDVLDNKHNTKLPGIVGWNLIKLSYQEFIKEHDAKVFDILSAKKEWTIYFFTGMCLLLS